MKKVVFTLFTSMLFLTSCEKEPNGFSVTFNSNGGSNVATQIVVEDKKAVEPSPTPTKNADFFGGWFTDNNTFSNKWDFCHQTVTADIALYAKWKTILFEKITLPPHDGGGNDVYLEKTVSLIEHDSDTFFENTVILYEDENYLVKTPLFYFLGNLKAFFPYDYKKHFSTLEEIISDSKTSNLLYSSFYFEKNMMHYVLAHFLETGCCYFYDKQKESNAKRVLIEYWSDMGELSGGAGRRFYIYDNTLFLWTVDLIS